MLFGQRPRQQAALVQSAGHEQVVVQRQRVERARRFRVDVPRRRPSDRSSAPDWSRRSRSSAGVALKRRKPSASSSAPVSASIDAAEGQQRQRRRHVAADPDVFVAVAHEDTRAARPPLRRSRPAPRAPRISAGDCAAARPAAGRTGNRRRRACRRCRWLRAPRRGWSRTSAARAAAGTRVLDVAERARHVQAPRRPCSRVSAENAAASLRRSRDRLEQLLPASAAAATMASAGSLLVDERPHHVDRGFAAQRGERRNRGDADARCRGSFSARSTPGSQRSASSGAGASATCNARARIVGRLVRQQQRRHQMALVHRVEQIDRVEHAPRLGMRQLADERLDRRGIGIVEPQRPTARRPVARCCGGTSADTRGAPPSP